MYLVITTKLDDFFETEVTPTVFENLITNSLYVVQMRHVRDFSLFSPTEIKPNPHFWEVLGTNKQCIV